MRGFEYAGVEKNLHVSLLKDEMVVFDFLSQGRGDATVVSELIYESMKNVHPSLYKGKAQNEYDISIRVNKFEVQTLEKINTAITQLLKEDAFTKIIMRYTKKY